MSAETRVPVWGHLSAREQGLAAMLAAAVLLSTGALFIKLVSVDVYSITMWRGGIAALALALMVRPRWPAGWHRDPLTWAIALSYGAMLLLFVVAARATTAANAIFLQYTGPFYVVMVSWPLLRERVTRVDLIAVAVAFGGMALFFFGRLEIPDVWGNVAAIGAGISFGAFLVCLRFPGADRHLRVRGMVVGNGALLAVFLAVNLMRPGSGAFTPDAGDAASLIFLGVVQIGVAYVVFAYAIARITALEAGLIGMVEPVLNPVWVFIFLAESPGWWAVVGGAVILAAVGFRTVLSARQPASGKSLA
jgi:drug/metabolite transporter, DME family